MLQIENLDIFYGQAQVAFNLTMSVAHGHFVGLFGRNGSGKSSVFRAVMGLKPPRVHGKILFKGTDVTNKPSFAISKMGVGWVPEDRKIFPNITIKRNLQLGEKSNKDLPKGSKVFGYDDA